jgi:hypothetical protein
MGIDFKIYKNCKGEIEKICNLINYLQIKNDNDEIEKHF